MVSSLRTRLLPLAAALLAVAGSAGAAEAGWVTVQNDTNRVVVVQGTVHCNGQTKRCKPLRLLPGESAREHHPAPALKVEVFDGQDPIRALFSGHFSLKTEDHTFKVVADGRRVSVVPAPQR